MPRRILIIQGHPDPDPARLCRALAEAYAEGAHKAGHEVARLDLAQMDIPLLRSETAFKEEPPTQEIRRAQEALLAAEHVVVIFPLWLGTLPALVKAFFEQTLRPGFAFATKGKGFPKGRLKGRSVRLVVTMGMPALAYRWLYGAHALKGLSRSLFGFVGLKPVRQTLFGMVASASQQRRQGWLDEMRRLGERAR
ncbi:NAD(P)H-dependent oxidoreductase [Aquibaculum arenosum]|uniref:NAD(P)H-dependent oxidoreductase n=1 Tax=Aquibaculum arenosum TaxID=3032591 RepID=A0ABT5YLQ6_9PROT|nr:NAD(P)H-dependent oxidoreductase [Fodinicurvata sp. CAU 1616]MDF2095870.1 NAD(P)H-dependent oxidoreductase [Fodinicurvata sp. CAU 1616]